MGLESLYPDCPLGRYFAAIDELWPRLPRSERQAKLDWERSDAFTRDSDWPGWVKHLGPRPQPAVAKSRKAV
jgi:hypothetical protein